MEKKKMIIMIVALLVFVLLFVSFLSIVFRKPKVSNITPQPITDIKPVEKPITNKQKDDIEILNTARGFVQVFGTFSSHSNFSNIKELYPFMTDKMIEKYKTTIASYKNSNSTFSKNTGVLGASFTNYKEGDDKAVVKVLVTERSNDNVNPEQVATKDYSVSLVKENLKWKVDEIK